MDKHIEALFRRAGADPRGVTHIGAAPFSGCLLLPDCRAAKRLPAAARSVIVFLFPYFTGEFPGRNVARYAVPPDYHRVAGGILAACAERLAAACPGEEFVPFVDSSPIREVAAAVRAGLGVRGLHGLLIHREFGSRVFIGTIVTTLELLFPPVGEGSCLRCGNCLAACPTGALAAGRPLDRTLCRSHITQKKGGLTAWEEQQVREGGLVWGCDLCTDACPMTTGALSPIAAFYEEPLPALTPQTPDAALGGRAYGYRGRAVLERNLRILAAKP